MAEPTAPPAAPTGGETIPGPVPRDPPPPPGYVDPVGQSPVLDGLVEKGLDDDVRASEAGRPERAEPPRRAEKQPHTSS